MADSVKAPTYVHVSDLSLPLTGSSSTERAKEAGEEADEDETDQGESHVNGEQAVGSNFRWSPFQPPHCTPALYEAPGTPSPHPTPSGGTDYSPPHSPIGLCLIIIMETVIL